MPDARLQPRVPVALADAADEDLRDGSECAVVPPVMLTFGRMAVQIGDARHRALIELLRRHGSDGERRGLQALLAELRGDDHFLELSIGARFRGAG